ncbi:hypothetical protein BFW01_g113 [Lasiodiplodia theobromae]|uniref:Uncharacterized protein n=1 Tax=Lasiodiplodia theobromae TaxID=45133 RepID=A0A8H7MB18_9PEZI|nr:hypothetical protein BFW01_g113 [Lasiodiplodia theobromae]
MRPACVSHGPALLQRLSPPPFTATLLTPARRRPGTLLISTAFGRIKGTAYKTAPKASAAVALQIAARPKNIDTLNNLPPPAAEVAC